jgi:hypothetical protein
MPGLRRRLGAPGTDLPEAKTTTVSTPKASIRATVSKPKKSKKATVSAVKRRPKSNGSGGFR